MCVWVGFVYASTYVNRAHALCLCVTTFFFYKTNGVGILCRARRGADILSKTFVCVCAGQLNRKKTTNE